MLNNTLTNTKLTEFETELLNAIILQNKTLEQTLFFLKNNSNNLIEEAINLGIINVQILAEILEKSFNIKWANLKEISLSYELFEKLDYKFLLKHNFIPFSEDSSNINVAIYEIKNYEKLEIIKLYLEELLEKEKTLTFFFESSSNINKAIEKEFSSNYFENTLKPLQTKATSLKVEGSFKEPITEFTEALFKKLLYEEETVLIKLTNFGELHFKKEIFYFTKENFQKLVTKIKNIFDIKPITSSNEVVAFLNAKIGFLSGVFKLQISPCTEEEVMFISGFINEIKMIEDFNFSKQNLQKISKGLEKSTGLVVITGEQNSGIKIAKSLGFAMALKGKTVGIYEENMEPENLIFTKLTKKESLGFTNLETIILTNPEHFNQNLYHKKVIMMDGAFDTLNTAKRYEKNGFLSLIIHQKTLKKLCSCKLETPLKQEDLSVLRLAKTDVKTIYTKNGCKRCNNTGYKDEIIICEVLNLDFETEEYIEDASASKKIILENLKKKGFSSIFEDARLKVLQGVTDIFELRKII